MSSRPGGSQPLGAMPAGGMSALRRHARSFLEHGIEQVLPHALVNKAVQREGDALRVNNELVPLAHNAYLVGFGKAVGGMANVMQTLLSDHLVEGIVSVPQGTRQIAANMNRPANCRGTEYLTNLLLESVPVGKIRVVVPEPSFRNIGQVKWDAAQLLWIVPPVQIADEVVVLDPVFDIITSETGKHREMLPDPSGPIKVLEGARDNVPDDRAVAAAADIVALMQKLKDTDILIVLISGGGSALLTYPVPPLTLKDVTRTTQLLQSNGARITEINAVRKRISAVKGGGLLRQTTAQMLSLILSDVVDDPLASIASGPTVPNKDDPGLPLRLLDKYHIRDKVPPVVVEVLERVVSHLDPPITQSLNVLIGNNKVRYRELEQLKESAERAFDMGRPICVVTAGETTVHVTGSGKGGRCQELALAAAIELNRLFNHAELQHAELVVLAAGTDGQDGPTDAAGAMVHITTVPEASAQGIDAIGDLERNDSHHFFRTFNSGADHLITGLTGTNVMDLHMLLLRRKPANS
ncbi:glycerate kinase isoform X2 [Rhipicephalus microplus]|uniref:glycerate kinase isoform X2 n=1 Tax=Rhipicephalus microplus TaxID=6941 RepID=UPI003F6C4B1E